MEYIRRYAEKDIERALRSSGAVVVAGPKFCGKTTTCMRFQKSFVKLNTLKEKIATKSSEPLPSFMMVLTARGSLYQREDGIYVVPINCLKD